MQRSMFATGGGEPVGGRRALLRWAGWFWFLIATLTMLVGIKYPLAAGFPQTAEGGLFFALLTLSHWYILLYLLVPLLFLPLILLVPAPKLVRPLGMVLATLCLTLVVVDAFSFSLYRFHLNGFVFSLLFSDAGGEIFVFDPIVYLSALAGLALILALVWWINRLAWRMVQRQNARRLGYQLAAAIVIAFLGQNFWFALANATGNHDITSQARLYPGYLPTRADDALRELGLVDEVSAARRLQAVSGAVDYPKSPISCEAQQGLPNIFVMVVDSWRYDQLNAEVTPHIQALAEESLQFTNHYSGGNNTRTGLFSLLYGLPATYWESFLDARAGSALINAIQAQGYDLAIYASAKLTAPEFDRTIFADAQGVRKQTDADSVYGRDALANREFVAHIKAAKKRPVFGLLFYDAPHSYAYAEKYRDHFQPAAKAVNYFALGKDSDPQPLLNLYRNAVISDDALVGEALGAIREAGMWDNSVIIVTADHGQEFNDNGLGFWGHNGNFTDAQIRVPFIVKWPGRTPQQFDYRTTHYDLAPTLMQELLGCRNAASDYSVGTSLFSSQPREDFVVGGFGDFAVRLENKIYWADRFGGVQVLSAHNRPLEEQPDAKILKQAFEQTSRYLR